MFLNILLTCSACCARPHKRAPERKRQNRASPRLGTKLLAGCLSEIGQKSEFMIIFMMMTTSIWRAVTFPQLITKCIFRPVLFLTYGALHAHLSNLLLSLRRLRCLVLPAQHRVKRHHRRFQHGGARGLADTIND